MTSVFDNQSERPYILRPQLVPFSDPRMLLILHLDTFEFTRCFSRLPPRSGLSSSSYSYTISSSSSTCAWCIVSPLHVHMILPVDDNFFQVILVSSVRFYFTLYFCHFEFYLLALERNMKKTQTFFIKKIVADANKLLKPSPFQTIGIDISELRISNLNITL